MRCQLSMTADLLFLMHNVSQVQVDTVVYSCTMADEDLQKALDTDISRIAAETAAAPPQGSHEFFEAIKRTAFAAYHQEKFELAWSLYQDGHRLIESQFKELGRLLDGYREDYDFAGGYDDEARERKNNLSRGISLARGRCEECPQNMRA